MGHRDEPGLELGWRQEDPPVQHRPEEPGEPGSVGCECLGGVDGRGRTEEDCQKRTDPTHGDGATGLAGRRFETRGERRGHLLQREIAVRVEGRQRRDPSGHGQRMARQRAGLVDRAGRSHELHEVSPATVRADRHPPADDLAERREIGSDPEAGLGTAGTYPEAGDHLIEDEHGAVRTSRLAKMLKEARRRRDDPDVRRDRLHDHGRDPTLVLVERARHGTRVVVRQDDGLGRRGLRHPGTARDRVGHHARARLDEEPIGMAVVATGELHDQVAAGGGTGEPQRAHDRFRARRGEAQPLNGGHRPPDRLAEFDLKRMRRAEGEPIPGRGHDGIDDSRMTVAKDRRSPGPDVVDVAPAVDIPDVRPLAALEEQRRPVDGPERSDRAVHPTRKEVLRTGHQPSRPRGGAGQARHGAPSSDTISSIGRWIPRRIGVSLTVDRRLSVLRRARTRSPKATRSSVSYATTNSWLSSPKE